MKDSLGITRGQAPRRRLFEADQLTPEAETGLDPIVGKLATGQITAADIGCDKDSMEAVLEWLASIRKMQ